MPSIPPIVGDLGVTAFALFMFVAAIYLIFKIIVAIKGGSKSNGNGRTPCIQSPFVTQLVSGQQSYIKAVDKIEKDTSDIKTNVQLLTQLIERVAVVQEKLADCIPRDNRR